MTVTRTRPPVATGEVSSSRHSAPAPDMAGGGWRLGTAVADAAAAVVADAAMSVFLVAVVVAAVAAAIGAEAAEIQGIIDYRAELQARGGYVLVAAFPESGGSGSALRCDQLRQVEGVVAAGAVVSVAPARTARHPGNPFPVVVATPGLVDLWDPAFPGATEPGLVVGSELASRLSLRSGDVVSMDQGVGPAPPVPVVGVANPTRRTEAAGWAFDLGTGSEPFEECWVEAEPRAFGAVADVLATWFGATSSPTVRRLFGDQPVSRDLSADFHRRPTQHVWLFAVAVVVLTWALVLALTRSRLGLYRAVGTSLRDLGLLVGLRAWLIVSWSAAGAAVLTVAGYRAIADAHPTVAKLMLGRAALIPPAAVLGIVLLAAALMSGSVNRMLKDR